MTEADAIERTDEPITVDRLVEDLQALGIEAGKTYFVHTSMSSLGWVCVGPSTVVDALREVITPEGTLVMPTHSTQYSDPATWSRPPVPDEWIETVRTERAPYRPAVTPTRGMGAVAECFRSSPDVVRSRHPSLSMAAWGADAEAIVADHPYDHPLGEDSPLARLYECDARVLLLGVDHAVNTSIHLAEYRADLDLAVRTNTAPVLEDGEKTLVTYELLETSTEDFPDLGAAFEDTGAVTVGTVGEGTARLMAQSELVDFAVSWLEEHR